MHVVHCAFKSSKGPSEIYCSLNEVASECTTWTGSTSSSLLPDESSRSPGWTQRGQFQTFPRATIRTSGRFQAVATLLLQVPRCVCTFKCVKSHWHGTRSLQRVEAIPALDWSSKASCVCLPALSAGVAPPSPAVPCRCSPQFWPVKSGTFETLNASPCTGIFRLALLLRRWDTPPPSLELSKNKAQEMFSWEDSSLATEIPSVLCFCASGCCSAIWEIAAELNCTRCFTSMQQWCDRPLLL